MPALPLQGKPARAGPRPEETLDARCATAQQPHVRAPSSLLDTPRAVAPSPLDNACRPTAFALQAAKSGSLSSCQSGGSSFATSLGLWHTTSAIIWGMAPTTRSGRTHQCPTQPPCPRQEHNLHEPPRHPVPHHDREALEDSCSTVASFRDGEHPPCLEMPPASCPPLGDNKCGQAGPKLECESICAVQAVGVRPL